MLGQELIKLYQLHTLVARTNMTWTTFITSVSAAMIISMLVVAVMLNGCTLLEINMVNRSTMDSGDGATSNRQEVTSDEDEETLELIVPIK